MKNHRSRRLIGRATFLTTKKWSYWKPRHPWRENWRVEEIPVLELSEYICEFIISFRTKDGKDYEPSSLRSLLASFERHLKKNSYSASIMNDLVFEKTRKVLLPKQKELKKKGKGNKTKRWVKTLLWYEMLLFITSFKISYFPFAEILKRKCWSFYTFELIKLILLSRNFEKMLKF